MKKLLMTTAMVALLSSPAMAATTGLYVGADAEHTQFLSSDTSPDTFNSGGLHVGANFTPNFGVELGASTSLQSDANGVTKANETTYAADLMGYLPTAVEKLDLVGLVGATYNTLDSHVSGVGNEAAKYGAEIGTGVQYQLTNHFSTRALVKYEDISFKDTGTGNLDNAVQYSLGVNYSF